MSSAGTGPPSASAMPRWNAAVMQSNNTSRERRYSESTSSALALTANLFSDRQSVPRTAAVDGIAAGELASRNVPDTANGKPRPSSLVNSSDATSTACDRADSVVARKISTGSALSSIGRHGNNDDLQTADDSSTTTDCPSASSSSKNQTQSSDCLETLTNSYRSMLVALGEDPEREGLVKTPERAALAMMYFTKGYKESVAGQ